MGKDRFDFHVADQLVAAVIGAADALDVKNGQLEKQFGALHESFKDSGYDAYELDMSAISAGLKAVEDQMKAVAKHIAVYADKMRSI